MRVKIGHRWFEVTADAPIMIELTRADRENIAGMIAGANRYAEFHEADPMTVVEKGGWMDDGARPAERDGVTR